MPFDPNTGGRLATPIESFHAHITGAGFQQPASSITTSPGISGASDLQTSLNNIQTFINAAEESGIGYAAVPETYNSYRNATPTVFFDPTTLSLDSLLNPIFSAITMGGTLPVGYERLKFGGVLFIPAGTYYVVNSITVPPGITILGEGYGTKIVNATRLNLSASPPSINGAAVPKPVFIIATDTNRSTNDAAVDPSLFMFGRAAQFINLTICDNFVEPTLLGDFNYVLPQNDGSNSTPNIGLIQQNQGSNFVLQYCNLIGRITFSSGTIVSDATQYAIALDTTLPVTTGTYLKISNCMIDGFSQPVNFQSKGGIFDYFELSNSKVRSHGYLTGDGSGQANNCIVATNDSNVRIVSNDLFGNHSACLTILAVLHTLGSAPHLDSISKLLVANNDFVIDRGDTGSITPAPYFLASGIAGSFDSYGFIIAYGNIYDDVIGFEITMGQGVSTSLRAHATDVTVYGSASLNLGGLSSPIATTGRVRMQNQDGILARNDGDTADIPLISTDSSDDILIGDASATNDTIIKASSVVALEPGGAYFEYTSTNVINQSQNGSPPVSGTSYGQLWVDGNSRPLCLDAPSNVMQIGKVAIYIHADLTSPFGSPPGSASTLSFNMNSGDAWFVEFNGVAECSGAGAVVIQFGDDTNFGIEGGFFSGAASAATVSGIIGTSTPAVPRISVGAGAGVTFPVHIWAVVGATATAAFNVRFWAGSFGQTATLLAGSTLRAHQISSV